MPKLAKSGIKGLYKKHNATCKNRKYPEDCNCSWKGKYKGANKVLAVWAGVEVNPRDKDAAGEVFTRLKASIDGKRFDERGEHKSLGSDDLFTNLIDSYIEEYIPTAGPNGGPLASTSQLSTLKVIQAEKHAELVLGQMKLLEVAGNPSRIKQWLDALAKARGIGPKTWNDYHQKLSKVCDWATKQKVNDVPKMAKNPMLDVPRRKTRDYSEASPNAVTGGRIPPEIEARLFAACETMDERHGTQARKLTQAKADAIRQQVEDGKLQKDVAKKFKVSASVVSAIVKGDIWTGQPHPKMLNKGSEMKRRLIGALDGGLRALELMKIQVSMVDWRGVMVSGERVLPITLPADVTKGGKTTSRTEYVFATTKRFIEMLEERREQLNRNPKAFIFGTETGDFQASFRRQYANLYEAAGLVRGRDYGRDLGFTWHTTRHEYASTVSEQNNGNERRVMALTRIKDSKTAKRYTHTYDSEVLQAAVNMRGNK